MVMLEVMLLEYNNSYIFWLYTGRNAFSCHIEIMSQLAKEYFKHPWNLSICSLPSNGASCLHLHCTTQFHSLTRTSCEDCKT